jgi:hypothetical protein
MCVNIYEKWYSAIPPVLAKLINSHLKKLNILKTTTYGDANPNYGLWQAQKMCKQIPTLLDNWISKDNADIIKQ